MTGDLHIYRAPAQPATRWRDDAAVRYGAPRRYWRHTNPPNRLLPTFCCGKRRPAKNLIVQVYYDAIVFRCPAGKGCNVPRRRMPFGLVLLREFARGLTVVGLARKYGRTSAEIQAAIRRANNRVRARS